MQPQYPPPSSYSYPATNGIKNEGVKIELGLLPPASASTPVPGPSAPLANNIANLLSTLMKAGVVSANGTPTGAGATSKEEDFKPAPVDLERESSRAYRKSILAHKIKLTSADITKYVHVSIFRTSCILTSRTGNNLKSSSFCTIN